MYTWKVKNTNRLLDEVKKKFLNIYTTKDLRWSIEHNRCFINTFVERFCSALVQNGDCIHFFPEKIPIFLQEQKRVLYEDSYILVYDKPPYLPSEKLASITHTLLAHRLDRDTSGVILLAKKREVLPDLEHQFRKRSIYKKYLAIVVGRAQKKGIISGKMALRHKRQGAVVWGNSNQGIWSQTEWSCLQHFKNCSLLECRPITGRTHQIRVHLSSIGHPLLGDYTYGYRNLENLHTLSSNLFFQDSSDSKKCEKCGGQAFRPLLHACELCFMHPITHQSITCFSPLPSDFGKDVLFKKNL